MFSKSILIGLAGIAIAVAALPAQAATQWVMVGEQTVSTRADRDVRSTCRRTAARLRGAACAAGGGGGCTAGAPWSARVGSGLIGAGSVGPKDAGAA